MNKKKAILVDDEPNAIQNLTILLTEYCPSIEIVATASCVDEAVIAIKKYVPDVIFLDIEMPEKSGFELFNEVDATFKTIFVTAYDEYAIRAFEVSAVDYLLKPIGIKRLQQSISKLSLINNANIEVLKDNVSSKELRKIFIPNTLGSDLVLISDIICMKADSVYTTIYYEYKGRLKTVVYSKPLVYFHDLTANNSTFYRAHRSWLINFNKIKSFNKNNLLINMYFDIEVALSRGRKKEFFLKFF